MRNTYPGICYRCGEIVKTGEGHFERLKSFSRGVAWRTQHAECAIKYRGTAHTYEAAKSAAKNTEEPTP